MALPHLPFTPSVYRAAIDLLLTLDEASVNSLTLSDAEVQAIAYFGRVVAHAWDERATGRRCPLPYVFTYGLHGGPLSEDITMVSNMFVDRRYIRTSSPPGREDVRLFQLSALKLLEALQNPAQDQVEAAPFIRATCRAGAILSMPGLTNAIQQEPSLRSARIQGLRAGVPLGDRQGEVVEFIDTVLSGLEDSRAFEDKPGSLAMVLLDALRWQQEKAS